MNDVYVGDEKLISTTRASELSGYSQDYVGQLCREEKIECRRISGHWYIDEQSLTAYQKPPQTADAPADDSIEKKKPYGIKVGNVRDDTFTYDGIEYIATSRAAGLTGYAQDYIGQLARNGEVEARKVGRRWFVGRTSLIQHKKKSDAMLAAVQAEAAGLGREPENKKEDLLEEEGTDGEVEIHKNVDPGDIHFNVRYVTESDRELMPQVPERVQSQNEYTQSDISREPSRATQRSEAGHIRVTSEGGFSKSADKQESRIVRKAIVRESRESTFQPSAGKKPKRKSFNHSVLIFFVFVLIFGGISYFVYEYGIPIEWINTKAHEISTLDVVESFQDDFGHLLPGREIEYSSE